MGEEEGLLVVANMACLCRQFLQEANAKPEAKH